jgi:hypothetical protein
LLDGETFIIETESFEQAEELVRSNGNWCRL